MKSLLFLFLMTSIYRFKQEVDEQSYIEKLDHEKKRRLTLSFVSQKDMTKRIDIL